jgi:hypothetical protein
MKVDFTDVRKNSVLWSNDALSFSEGVRARHARHHGDRRRVLPWTRNAARSIASPPMSREAVVTAIVEAF